MSHEESFRAFMNNVAHDAETRDSTDPHTHAEQMLEEVREALLEGVQSKDEATALAAKLDVALENAPAHSALRGEIETCRKDLDRLYPDAR